MSKKDIHQAFAFAADAFLSSYITFAKPGFFSSSRRRGGFAAGSCKSILAWAAQQKQATQEAQHEEYFWFSFLFVIYLYIFYISKKILFFWLDQRVEILFINRGKRCDECIYIAICARRKAEKNKSRNIL